MDPNQPAQSSENLPPRKEPHLPISMAETHPEIYNENSTTNSKNTLLTLASLLVLAGIVGITLWLYIQNKTKVFDSRNSSQKTQFENTTKNELPFIALKKDTQMVTDVNTALSAPEKAGFIDLTMQKEVPLMDFSKFVNATTLIATGDNLDEIPVGIYEITSLERLELPSNNIKSLSSKIGNLKNLKILNLTNNELTSLPKEIGNLTDLESLYLTNNKLTSIPSTITNLKNLKELRLLGNKVSQTQIEEIKKNLPNTKIIYPQ